MESLTAPAADGRLWQLMRKAFPGRDALVALDVGAYRGDFTAELLACFPGSRVLLFEPSPESYETLRVRFAENEAVEIVRTALSSRSGTATLYRAGPAYNNSLLPPVQGGATSEESAVDTLDHAVATQLRSGEKIDLLKVDAQGHDLQILLGAGATVRGHQPAVLVELIFADLYAGQDSYYDIFSYMKDAGYRVAALLQTHATAGGADAFADALFLPPRLHALAAGTGPDYVCLDADHHRRQIEVLQKACDERLELINRLSETAAERLRQVQSLQARRRRPSLRRLLPWAR